IISSSWDGTVRMVDFYSLSERLVLTQRRMGRSPFVTVSPDGRFLFSFSYDIEKSPLCQSNIVRQWSYHTGDMVRIFSNTGVHKSGTRGGACMPVGDHLYTLSNSGYLNLFDLRSGRLINETSIAEDFRTMCVIPERNLIIASDTNGSIYLYHIIYKRILASWKIHQNDITCIKVYPGNPDIIVTCSFDGFVKIWELPEFNLIEVLPIDQHELWSCEFIGNLLAVGSTSGFIYIYGLVDLSAISLKARMFLSKQAYVIFPENSTHFYCNDSSLLSINRKEDDSMIIGKHAGYLFELFNSRNVLDRLFGGDNPLNESGSIHTKLTRQIPANLTRQL
ncbi:MAG: hypothetical protein JXA23_03550, partial [Bacteroidales bacterium]|nr:hypothetical protein [Bacteroidales bacterium]